VSKRACKVKNHDWMFKDVPSMYGLYALHPLFRMYHSTRSPCHNNWVKVVSQLSSLSVRSTRNRLPARNAQIRPRWPAFHRSRCLQLVIRNRLILRRTLVVVGVIPGDFHRTA
jgi:hypothetical protein